MRTSFPIRAVLLSGFGALIGSALWLLIAIAANLERAIPALLVGVLAGAATRIEPNRGFPTRLLSVAITLIGLTIVQYFVARHAVVNQLVEAGRDRSIPMFLSPGSMWSVTFGWLRAYPVDIGSWAVSVTAAFVLPRGASEIMMPSDAFMDRVG